jgi:hypothetical protein
MRVAKLTAAAVILGFFLLRGQALAADSKEVPDDKAAAAVDNLLDFKLPEITLKNNALIWAIQFLRDATCANIYVGLAIAGIGGCKAGCAGHLPGKEHQVR